VTSQNLALAWCAPHLGAAPGYGVHVAARVICVPYVVGREAEGMGAGPLALAQPAAEALATDDVRRVSLSAPRTTEVAACFDLNRGLAAEVTAAQADGVLPVVLTGNCHSQQAVIAGLGSDGLGLVWMDCHGDFHTPETTESGYFDGYGLAMVVGACWQTLCATVPGFAPLPEEDVVLVGVRDMEAGERERLERSAIRRVGAGEIRRLADEVDGLPAGRVSLHVDLDVLDPAYGRANQYAAPPGLTPDELIAAVSTVARDRELAALTFSAYDPSYDEDGTVREVALAVLRAATQSYRA
jgi:arginase